MGLLPPLRIAEASCFGLYTHTWQQAMSCRYKRRPPTVTRPPRCGGKTGVIWAHFFSWPWLRRARLSPSMYEDALWLWPSRAHSRGRACVWAAHAGCIASLLPPAPARSNAAMDPGAASGPFDIPHPLPTPDMSSHVGVHSEAFSLGRRRRGYRDPLNRPGLAKASGHALPLLPSPGRG